MTLSGMPARASSTAWAWRSWCAARSGAGYRLGRRAGELDARVSARPRPPGGRAVDDAKQRPARQSDAGVEPGPQLLPAPGVHADLAAATALTVADQQ